MLECIRPIDRPESRGVVSTHVRALRKTSNCVDVASAIAVLPCGNVTRLPRVRGTKDYPGGGTSEFVVVVGGGGEAILSIKVCPE